jgi:hypothetical protein
LKSRCDNIENASQVFPYVVPCPLIWQFRHSGLKAKIAVALHDELGRVPKKEEIEQVFLLARMLYKAVLGLHFKRQEQKQSGQLAIF